MSVSTLGNSADSPLGIGSTGVMGDTSVVGLRGKSESDRICCGVRLVVVAMTERYHLSRPFVCVGGRPLWTEGVDLPGASLPPRRAETTADGVEAGAQAKNVLEDLGLDW